MIVTKLFSVFAAIIMFITVFSIVKVLHIAYKNQEITKKKFQVFSTLSILLGLGITGAIIMVFYQLFDILNLAFVL